MQDQDMNTLPGESVFSYRHLMAIKPEVEKFCRGERSIREMLPLCGDAEENIMKAVRLLDLKCIAYHPEDMEKEIESSMAFLRPYFQDMKQEKQQEGGGMTKRKQPQP